ncbi:MAG TPA: hypothetical protein PLF35_14280, partial [Prolixibacteraceae bacterium]|nr:hypothetical protein [Prolixibacteraceae bacterium]
MKPKVIIIGLVALIATACSTSLQTGSNYIDDLYYWPGDNIPEISSEELTALSESTQPGGNTIIVSELEEGNDGTKTLNNYIYADEEPSWFNDVQAYNLDNIESEGNDTIFFTDEESGSYVVNNYYIDDDYSYADRIRRFHNPFFYDPFYWD